MDNVAPQIIGINFCSPKGTFFKSKKSICNNIIWVILPKTKDIKLLEICSFFTRESYYENKINKPYLYRVEFCIFLVDQQWNPLTKKFQISNCAYIYCYNKFNLETEITTSDIKLHMKYLIIRFPSLVFETTI